MPATNDPELGMEFQAWDPATVDRGEVAEAILDAVERHEGHPMQIRSYARFEPEDEFGYMLNCGWCHGPAPVAADLESGPPEAQDLADILPPEMMEQVGSLPAPPSAWPPRNHKPEG